LIRVGPGLPALQWDTIERLKPTTLVAVPSFIVKLIEYAEQNGLRLDSSSVRKAICIGEPIRSESLQLNKLGQRITEAWNIKLYSTYASTEMQTAFTECAEGAGGHLHPELLYVELLDENGNQVKAGENGEITITTLGVEGMPLIRYRTGDVATMYVEPCRCGRNTIRLGPIIGRKQQMIKLKGTTLYPPAIFDLLNIPIVKDYVVEAFTSEFGVDEVRLHIHTENDELRVGQALLELFQSRLRVKPQITFTSAPDIEKMQHTGSTRKLKKFLDNRK
jgi:phenylacetate-CoA ligase